MDYELLQNLNVIVNQITSVIPSESNILIISSLIIITKFIKWEGWQHKLGPLTLAWSSVNIGGSLTTIKEEN